MKTARSQIIIVMMAIVGNAMGDFIRNQSQSIFWPGRLMLSATVKSGCNRAIQYWWENTGAVTTFLKEKRSSQRNITNACKAVNVYPRNSWRIEVILDRNCGLQTRVCHLCSCTQALKGLTWQVSGGRQAVLPALLAVISWAHVHGVQIDPSHPALEGTGPGGIATHVKTK